MVYNPSALRGNLYNPRFVIMALAVIVSLYWLIDGVAEIISLQKSGEEAALSKLGLDIPSLKSEWRAEGEKHVSGYGVWGLEVPEGRAARGGAEAGEGAGAFAQKLFKGIPAVYSVENEKYRWEFYGVVKRTRKKLAVFYNPTNEKAGWQQFELGQHLDGSLVLKEMDKDAVVISFDKEQKDFKLELFRARVKVP